MIIVGHQPGESIDDFAERLASHVVQEDGETALDYARRCVQLIRFVTLDADANPRLVH